jgi:pSer/pThr/pTyr-binding forkhead associated (FHA) protein
VINSIDTCVITSSQKYEITPKGLDNSIRV